MIYLALFWNNGFNEVIACFITSFERDEFLKKKRGEYQRYKHMLFDPFSSKDVVIGEEFSSL